MALSTLIILYHDVEESFRLIKALWKSTYDFLLSFYRSFNEKLCHRYSYDPRYTTRRLHARICTSCTLCKYTVYFSCIISVCSGRTCISMFEIVYFLITSWHRFCTLNYPFTVLHSFHLNCDNTAIKSCMLIFRGFL